MGAASWDGVKKYSPVCKWSRDQELHHNISINRFSFSSAKCKKLSRSVHLQQEIKLEWPYEDLADQ